MRLFRSQPNLDRFPQYLVRCLFRTLSMMIINTYPPTSPERRACETRYHQSSYYHLVRHPRAITASSSNSARPSSPCLQQARQDAANLINYLLIGATDPGHRGFQAARARASQCLQQPRLDAANLINYLFIGATDPGHRGFQAARPRATPAPPRPLKQPWGTHASSSQGRILRI